MLSGRDPKVRVLRRRISKDPKPPIGGMGRTGFRGTSRCVISPDKHTPKRAAIELPPITLRYSIRRRIDRHKAKDGASGWAAAPADCTVRPTRNRSAYGAVRRCGGVRFRRVTGARAARLKGPGRRCMLGKEEMGA